MRGAVDLAGQSAGSLEQRLDGGRLEQGQFAAGEAQPMGEVVVQLVAAEAADVVADDEALAERLVDGHGQPAAQFGESDEQHAQAAFGIHLEVREEPEILEDVVAQVLGLVDDEDRQLLGLLDETGDLVADRAVGGGAGALLGEAEFPCDRLVHVEDVAGGQGDVVDAVQSGVEAGGDVPADGGLAGSDLAGEQSDAAQFDEVLEARLGLAVGAGLEQLVGGEVVLEGQPGEGRRRRASATAQVHQSFSLSRSRMAMGDGGGSGAGSSVSMCEDGRTRRTAVLA